MNRIFYAICATSVILTISISASYGQDKKTEQKIKVIVDNGSGEKVVIDTVYYNSPGPDSIKLKDGSVVYLKQSDDQREFKHHNRGSQIFITASSDGKEDNKEIREITVVSSDSLPPVIKGDSNNIVHYRKSGTHEGKSREKYEVITKGSDGISEREETIYINKDKVPGKETENTYVLTVSDNKGDSTIEKSRYVIAKDGLVVTIEGNDDARAKELAREIEIKLGVKSEGTEKKETIKVESKKINTK